MATSWKLPLAAAAGEAAEPPPPPPAGPASPPGPATSAAEPCRWDRRGSPRRGGRCQLRGLLGLVVRDLGGPDVCLGGWGGCPAACRVSLGAWGRVAVGSVLGPRARKPGVWGIERSVVRFLGAPRSKLPRHAGPANVLEPPTRVQTGCKRPSGSWRGRFSLVCQYLGSHLMLPPELGREPGQDRRSRPGGLPGQGTSLSGFLRNVCAGCAVRTRNRAIENRAQR